MTRTGHDSGPARWGPGLPARFRLEYFAFHQLHYDTYLDYAYVRTGSRFRAVQCVEAVFDRLCDSWQAVLRGSPAARAWEMLHEQANCHSDCDTGHAWPIHCLLDGRQADVVLLHRRLRLSVDEAGDLMGMPAYAVRGLLRSADRALHALPLCVAPLFTDTLYGHGAREADTAQ